MNGRFPNVSAGIQNEGIPQPLLFSEEELQRQVSPRLEPAAIGMRLQSLAADAADLAGIGAAARVAEDPLGLGDLVVRQHAIRPARFPTVATMGSGPGRGSPPSCIIPPCSTCF